MPAVVSCSHCHKPLSVPDIALGKTVRCPLCDTIFVAAAPAPAASAVMAVPTRPEPTAASPAPILDAVPAPAARPRRPARTGGRKPFLWLIAASVALGVAVVVGVVLVFVLNRAEDRLPDNIWREVNNEHGGFRVLMPGTPQIRQAVPGFTTTGVDMDSNQHGFFVNYADMSDAEIRRVPLEQRFDRVRDGVALLQQGGRVLSDRKITLDGHAGREVECEVPEALPGARREMSNVVVRMFGIPMQGKVRFYLVLASGAGYRADTPDIRKFLDSFRPIPPAAGGPPVGPAERKQLPAGPRKDPAPPGPPAP